MADEQKSDKEKIGVIFDSINGEERIMIKKVILGEEITHAGITYKPVDFDTATLRGAIISVPKRIVERLKNDYTEKLKQQSINNDKHTTSCEIEVVDSNDE